MEIELKLVKKDEKEILRNLLEKYEYEFSQYDGREINNYGLFGYDYLDNYWTEENRFHYFIYVDNKLAGFVMINDYKEVNFETNYTLSEFFVIYKYRNMGVGKYVANYVFNRYNGKWQLTYLQKNEIAKKFRNIVVNECTKGNYEVKKIETEFETKEDVLIDVLIFET